MNTNSAPAAKSLRSIARAEKAAARKAHAEKMAKLHAAAAAVVATGKCPECGAGIHRNSSMTGWWQCDRSGSASFRRDPSGAHCSWQTFTA